MANRVKVVLLSLVALFAGRATAAYPEKPIQYIVPFSAGGELDMTARLQAQTFKAKFGQEMYVVNKPGAGGALAWSQLNAMPGDGYNIMGTNVPHIILQPFEASAPYKTEDITPVYFFHFTADAIMVPIESPFKTYDDLLKAAKEKPNTITFAGSAQYSANHMAHERFKKEAGVQTKYIPYKGTADLMGSLLGQHVSAAMTYLPIAVQQKGKIRLLAVASDKRSPHFPDVPTFKEVGLSWSGGAYRGVAVPKSTPPEIRKKISEIMSVLNTEPEFVKRMVDAGFEQVNIPIDQVPAFMEGQKKIAIENAKLAGLVKS